MNQQKAFYEIEKPAKKQYTVVVRGEINDTMCQQIEPFYNHAQVILGYVICGASTDERGCDVYECPCCGLWTCDDHMSKKAIHGELVCKSCANQSLDDMERIIAFREELNR